MTESAQNTDKTRRSARRHCISSSAIKLIKGVAVAVAGAGRLLAGEQDLSDMFDRFCVGCISTRNGFLPGIGDWLEHLHAGQRAGGWHRARSSTDCFSSSWAWGWRFARSWAVWLAIGESAFFIPIEIFELVRHHRPELPNPCRRNCFSHPKLGLSIVLALNVLIVWYLFANRKRLFRHHRIFPA